MKKGNAHVLRRTDRRKGCNFHHSTCSRRSTILDLL